jgi:hypothetical protein
MELTSSFNFVNDIYFFPAPFDRGLLSSNPEFYVGNMVHPWFYQFQLEIIIGQS